ncbi:MAG: bifunctional demethylmenaquinone methyltransferase/2-methoxy-6-polyprenyl-1,4-benzoquinol methylase UbiE [Bacteroidetes bacterium]|nr:bifunctional demethylmenaquinone methyltransferase/2-methoxy-6-polyprenyl-1,4-benzoquinol methylase UbiE [Bacteroidota bacterium]
MAANREEARRMFDAIAPTYDVLNRVLSFGVDALWRRRLIRTLQPLAGQRILDVACGTGDLLIGLSQEMPGSLVGLDLAPEMLQIAARRLRKAGVDGSLVRGAAECLPFASASFDVVSVAFGIRNFEDLSAGLREMHRVLRPGGQLRILEFSRPRRGLWGSLFTWYFVAVVPKIGRWISGHPEAYTYLPTSVAAFHDSDSLDQILRTAGLKVSASIPLTGGIATLTVAERPPSVLMAS